MAGMYTDYNLKINMKDLDYSFFTEEEMKIVGNTKNTVTLSGTVGNTPDANVHAVEGYNPLLKNTISGLK